MNTTLGDFGGKLLIKTTGTSVVQTGTNALNFSSTGTQSDGSTLASVPQSLNLTGSTTNNITSGTVSGSVTVSGTGNVLTGSPVFSNPITLANSSAELTLGLMSKLTNNLVLNGGKLILSNDLYLKDGVQIQGNGTLDLAGYSLVLPSYAPGISAFTGTITYLDANDITYSVRSTLTTTQNFTGSGTSDNIRGNGVIVNLTGGGVFRNGTNHTLYINDLHIKGLGSTGGGNITFDASNSKTYLTSCALDLAGNYTLTTGEMIVDGTYSKIMVEEDEHFIISGATAKLTVNNNIFFYENVSGLPRNPFVTTGGGTISKINNGDIRCAYIPGAACNLTASRATSTGVNPLESPLDLHSTASVTFINSTPFVAKSMILEGNNNHISFSNGTDKPFAVNQNITLTITNAILDNFDHSKFDLQGTGTSKAKIIFADGVTLNINKDLTIATADSALTFTGNAVIAGNGNTLSIDSQRITQGSANKTLSITGLNLIWNAADSILMSNASAKLLFQNCNLCMESPGITVATGNVDFKGNVVISSMHESNPEGSCVFSLTTSGTAKVLSNSMLKLDTDVTFSYNPNIAGELANTTFQKSHFQLQDPSATLYITKANLLTGTPGMSLSYGKVIVSDLFTVTTSLAAGKEFELGSSLNFTILNSGYFDVDGNVIYKFSTYP